MISKSISAVWPSARHRAAAAQRRLDVRPRTWRVSGRSLAWSTAVRNSGSLIVSVLLWTITISSLGRRPASSSVCSARADSPLKSVGAVELLLADRVADHEREHHEREPSPDGGLSMLGAPAGGAGGYSAGGLGVPSVARAGRITHDGRPSHGAQCESTPGARRGRLIPSTATARPRRSQRRQPRCANQPGPLAVRGGRTPPARGPWQ